MSCSLLRLRPMDLSVVFLGTGGSVPSARRATACVLIRAGGSRILIDAGEGAQRQMIASTGLVQVDDIYITHFHADHYLGLPGLLKTYDLMERAGAAPDRRARRAPRAVRGAAADLRAPPLRGRAGRARAGGGDRARRLRDARLPGRAPDEGTRLRLRRARTAGPLRRRRGTRTRHHRRPRLRPAAARRDRLGRRLGGAARPGARRGPRRAEDRDHRGHRALRDDPHRRTRRPAAGPRRDVRRRGVCAGSRHRSLDGARRRTACGARPRSTCWRSSTSRPATTSRRSSRRRETAFPNTVAPRDFDLVEIPFPERGDPELVKEGAKQRPEPLAGPATPAGD